MLNIDTRLMDLVTNETITRDDFYTLLCIAKRINRKNTAFPNRNTLMRETKMGKNKLFDCLTNLVTAGIIEKQQRHTNGRLSSNLYTVKTEYLGVFINLKDEKLEDSEAETDLDQENTVALEQGNSNSLKSNTGAQKQVTTKQAFAPGVTLSISNSRSISYKEVLVREKEEVTPLLATEVLKTENKPTDILTEVTTKKDEIINHPLYALTVTKPLLDKGVTNEMIEPVLLAAIHKHMTTGHLTDLFSYCRTFLANEFKFFKPANQNKPSYSNNSYQSYQSTNSYTKPQEMNLNDELEQANWRPAVELVDMSTYGRTALGQKMFNLHKLSWDANGTKLEFINGDPETYFTSEEPAAEKKESLRDHNPFKRAVKSMNEELRAEELGSILKSAEKRFNFSDSAVQEEMQRNYSAALQQVHA